MLNIEKKTEASALTLALTGRLDTTPHRSWRRS